MASTRLQRLQRIRELEDALFFYADPDSYFAIAVWPDRPAGAFADDFSDADHLAEWSPYERPMPGARAREALGIEMPQQRRRDYYG